MGRLSKSVFDTDQLPKLQVFYCFTLDRNIRALRAKGFEVSLGGLGQDHLVQGKIGSGRAQALTEMRNLGRSPMMTCKNHRAIAVAAILSFAAMAPTSLNAGDKKVEGAAKGAAVGAAVGAVTGVGVGVGAVTGAVIGGVTAEDSKEKKSKESKANGKPHKTKE